MDLGCSPQRSQTATRAESGDHETFQPSLGKDVTRSPCRSVITTSHHASRGPSQSTCRNARYRPSGDHIGPSAKYSPMSRHSLIGRPSAIFTGFEPSHSATKMSPSSAYAREPTLAGVGVGAGPSSWVGAGAIGSPLSAVQPATSKNAIANPVRGRRISDQPPPGELISRWRTAATPGGWNDVALCRR